MSEGTTDREPDPFTRVGTSAQGVLTVPATSLAALVLAFVALTGSNILVAGLQSVLGIGVGATVGPFGYLMSQAFASAAVAAVVVLLARPGLRHGTGWEVTASRAAVILAGLALVGAALVLVAGLLTGAGLLPF